MKYGEGFWCVENGVRLLERTYPTTRGFEYRYVDPADKTGDCGEWLIKSWCFDYTVPGTNITLRFTVLGCDTPVLHKTAFDFDWASIIKLLRTVTCDKADYRIRAGCLPHDIGFCVHEFWPGFTIKFWNEMLFEIMEAYSVTLEEVQAQKGVVAKAKMLNRYICDRVLRNAVLAGVTVGGPFVWKKSAEQIKTYRKMLTVERITA